MGNKPVIYITVVSRISLLLHESDRSKDKCNNKDILLLLDITITYNTSRPVIYAWQPMKSQCYCYKVHGRKSAVFLLLSAFCPKRLASITSQVLNYGHFKCPPWVVHADGSYCMYHKTGNFGTAKFDSKSLMKKC